MEFPKTSDNNYYLNKSTYVNLRWIAYFGQLTAILIVQFVFVYLQVVVLRLLRLRNSQTIIYQKLHLVVIAE